VVFGGDAGYADSFAVFEGVPGFYGCDFAGADPDAREALAYGTAAGAAWARGSPLAEKWDDAASDAIEDLVVAAVRREQQSGRRRRPYSARSGYTPF